MPDLKLRHSLISLMLLVTGIVSPQTGMAADHGVIIGFHEQPGSTHRKLINDLGGQISREYTLIPAVVAKIPSTNLTILRNHPLVAYVEENTEIKTMVSPYLPPQSATSGFFSASTEDEYQRSWGIQRIGSKAAHAQGVTGKGIKVAIIDSGIDYNHEDLDNNYLGGYDFVFDDDDPMDDSWNSHGTNIAGVIAAEKNGIGVVGVAPEASLYALKVLNQRGDGLMENIVAAIQWAVDNKMDIINISIEGEGSEALKTVCDAAYEAGLLIVAAAGNTKGGPASPLASYSSVVAATSTDKENNLASHAPISPEVELSAPGVSIYSTARTTSGGGYGSLDGTSQAAPHVTGMAALILSSGKLEDLNGDGETNNKDLRLMLQRSVDDLGDAGRDELFGYGLVNLRKVFPIHLERTEQWLAGWQTAILDNRQYRISIQNNSLYGIISWVSENGTFRRDLSAVHIFKGYRQQLPQQIDFELDATGKTLKVIFIPFGEIGSFADITIN